MATRLSISVVGVLLLAGCDQIGDKLSSWFWGTERHVTVISATPVQLSTTPIGFDLREPGKVVGSFAAVCLSLRGNLGATRADVMEGEFKSLMKEASVTTIVTTSGAKKVELRDPMQTWSKHGTIEKRDELSACLRAPAGQGTLAVGTGITRVEIRSSVPLDVRGIYWESNNIGDPRR